MLDNYRDLIDELLGGPSEVRTMADGVGGTLSPAARSLVAEMRDRDLAVTGRLQAFMRDADLHLPVLATANAAPDAAAPGETAELLAGMDQARGDLVSLLMNLALKDWERTATHDVDGEITLADEVERHVEFDEDHLSRIRAAVAGGTS